MKYIFKRKPNRIYSSLDFEDNEVIEFSHYPEHPNSKAKGYAFYKGEEGYTRLCEKDEVEAVPQTNFEKITQSVESFVEWVLDNYHSVPEQLPCTKSCNGDCGECFKEWLQKESE